MSDKKDRIHEETQEDQSRAQDSAQNKAQDEIQDGVQDGVHGISNPYGYIWPEDPAVREHLDHFRGLKLGFMMHWAPVGQIGTMESWPLSDGDRSWSKREIDWTDNETFKEDYWDLPKTFNPVKFAPESWAKIAKECGFKYLLFTTKHHDGFCMFDSAYSDYKITNPEYPFAKDPRSDIFGELVRAFRDQGMAVSAYFSKPDWHSEDFWAEDLGPITTCNASYDPKEHPERWEKYVQFVHNQLEELCSNYGHIDAIWLDGGWVRPEVNNQDIRLSEIAAKIREKHQPHLIVVDRSVGGVNENILTPEQQVPSSPIEVPWESCITLGRSFSFHYEDVLKSPREVVHMFIDILAKGGSLALNITPQPDGALPHRSLHTMPRFGRWVRKHEEAIYNSEISPLTGSQDIRYTRVDGNDYAFYLYCDHPIMPKRVYLQAAPDKTVSNVRLLRTGEILDFKQDGQEIIVETGDISLLEAEHAECFALDYA